MAKPNAKAPLGQGGRFAALENKFAAKGVTNPGGLAAYIGRKTVDAKYGSGKFAQLAANGRKRKAKARKGGKMDADGDKPGT